MPKNQDKNVRITLIVIFVVVTVLMGFAAFMINQFFPKQPATQTGAQSPDGEQWEPSQPSPEGQDGQQPPSFHTPKRMRGVFVEPGKELFSQLSQPLEQASQLWFQLSQQGGDQPEQRETEAILEESLSRQHQLPQWEKVEENTLREEVDQLLQQVEQYHLNTVFVRANTLLGTAWSSQTAETLTEFDAMDYLLRQAGERGLYLYVIYDLSLLPSPSGGLSPAKGLTPQGVNQAVTLLEEFTRRYQPNGILLDGYQNPQTEESYATYLQYGDGMGFDPYQFSAVDTLVEAAVQTVRQNAPNTQVGLAVPAVWATLEQREDGQDLSAPSTAWENHADTRSLAQSGLLDFIAVYNYGSLADQQLPFEAIAQWWDGLCGEQNLTGYMIHAADLCGTWGGGWNAPDQLALQTQAVDHCISLDGSVYNSLYSFGTNAVNNAASLQAYFEQVDASQTQDSQQEDSEEEQEEGQAPPEDSQEEQEEGQASPEDSQEEKPHSTEEDKPAETPEDQPDETPEDQPEDKPDKVLKELTFSKPDQPSVTTNDPTYTFQGAADPGEKVLLDGKELEMDENGMFSITLTLVAGENHFTFSQKDVSKTFTVTRNIQVLREVTPTGSLSVDGGTKVEISAVAYQNSQVTAALGGQTIPLTAAEQDESLRDSTYQRYSGSLTVPQAGSSAKSLGSIQVTASCQGVTESKAGAAVTVNPVVQTTQGRLVKVVSPQAITFPTSSLGKYPDTTCYPYPQGTLDYAVGEQLVYRDGEGARYYYNLASGRRVYSKDIQAVSQDTVLDGNAITGITVTADGNYTYVILKSQKPVPFQPSYSANQFVIQFSYTDATPEDMTLNQNPLFSAASWSGSKLTLTFRTPGGFLGYKAYHENGNIVFRFNNPTSLSGARIVIDPGHGGSDPGAEGFLRDYPEKEINWELSNAIADALESEGAQVLLLKTRSGGMSMDDRLAHARNFNAQIFISVHHNSSVNSAAAGTESYYFYPFAKSLASQLASAAAKALDTSHRGSQFDVFYTTRDPQFIGVLSEGGFVTNREEYNKLLDEDYQREVGARTAAAISSFLESAGASQAGLTGTQSVGEPTGSVSDGPSSPITGGLATDIGSQSNDLGPGVDSPQSGSSQHESRPGNSQDNPEDSHNPSDQVKSLSLNKSKVELFVGDKEELTAQLQADQKVDVRFATSDESVVKVSAQGTLYATGIGEATVTVEAGDKRASCTVVVYGTEADTGVFVHATGIEIQGPSAIQVGERANYTVTFYPQNASNPRVKWEISSAGQEYAELSSTGTLEGLAPGVARIRATSEDGGFTDTVTVEITQ